MPARNQVPIPAGVRWFRLVGADAHIGPYGVRASDTSVRVGGYKIRPYGPASGFPVGAGFMPARNQVPIPAGVRWFRLVGADAHIGPPPPGSGPLRRPHAPPSTL